MPSNMPRHLRLETLQTIEANGFFKQNNKIKCVANICGIKTCFEENRVEKGICGTFDLY